MLAVSQERDVRKKLVDDAVSAVYQAPRIVEAEHASDENDVTVQLESPSKKHWLDML
jgi:hypothetical protein